MYEVSHIALFHGEDLLACTKEYQNLHFTDQQLFYIVKESNTEKLKELEFSETVVFPTHTSLSDDIKSIGLVAFRLIVIKFQSIQLCVLADSETKVNQIQD
jgi:hypothetical protein